MINSLRKDQFCGVVLFLLLITAGSGFSARSQTIYVSTAGNDEHPGTSEQPLASVHAALEHARQLRKKQQVPVPVEILIGPGTYFLEKPLELTGEDSGTEEAPLIIKGQGPVRPVLSGGMKLPPFEEVSGGIWKIELPGIARFGGSIGQLFVNGKRATRARTPNKGQLFKTGRVSETIIDTGTDSRSQVAVQKISLNAEQIRTLEEVPPAGLQSTLISVNHAWDRTRKYIQAFSKEDSAVYITGRPMHHWNTLDNSSQFIFENAGTFLDAPGEWFLEPSGTLWYVPGKGERIDNSTAVIPVQEQLLIIRGNEDRKASHIRIEHLSFQFTRYLMPFRGNEPAQAAAPTEAALMLDHARDVQFLNCEIAHTGNNAIWFRASCSNSGITKSYLHDLGIGGVKIGTLRALPGGRPGEEALATQHITIDNNIIRSGGHEFPTGVGVIIFNASDNTISHNEIADFRYSGISVGWVWGYHYSVSKRNKIVYNHIHHLGWGLLSDMGGVYTLGPSEGTVVSNNVIHHVYSYGYGGWGLYTDEGSTGILMENNLVYRCKSSGFHQHYGKDNIIRNNIFAYQIKAQLEATRIEAHRSFSFTGNIIYSDSGILIGKPGWVKARFDADRNCYWDTRTSDIRFGEHNLKEWIAATGKDRHSIIADPGFVNPAKYDFHFKKKSVISKIGFQPFDYTKAGVYGDADWKTLALFDPKMAMEFDQMINDKLHAHGVNSY